MLSSAAFSSPALVSSSFPFPFALASSSFLGSSTFFSSLGFALFMIGLTVIDKLLILISIMFAVKAQSTLLARFPCFSISSYSQVSASAHAALHAARSSSLMWEYRSSVEFTNCLYCSIWLLSFVIATGRALLSFSRFSMGSPSFFTSASWSEQKLVELV